MDSLKDRIRSFKYAGAGVFDLFRSHPNAQIHFILMVLVIIAGIVFSVSLLEWCLLILCIVLVLSAEAFNSAIEYLVDLVSPERHPLAGKVKDMAAGAVLITAIGAALVGLLIFIPKALALLG